MFCMAQAAPSIERTGGTHDPAYAEAWQAVRNAHLSVVESIESELSKADLPALAWYDVLQMLDRSAAPVRPKEMLCHVSVTKSGLTRLLDRIEKAGLVERSYCPSDRRGTFLSITKAGRETLSRMKPIRDRVFEEHFVESFTTEEAELLREMMMRVSMSAIGLLEAEGECEV